MTRISQWRESQGLTQQQVADYLTERGMPLDRVSVGRIESGDQMPSAEVLEAMAELYNTDVDSMLNMTPEEAADVMAFKALKPNERRRALRTYKAAHSDGER